MSDIHDLEVNLDLKQNLNIYATCKQLDNLNLIFNVYDNSVQADLSNYNVRLKAMKADNVPLIQDTQYKIVSNVVTIAADEQLTTTSGITKIELQFSNKTTGEKKATFNLNLKVIASTLEVEKRISTATYTLLEELENKIDQALDLAENMDEAIEINNTLNTTIADATNAKSTLESDIVKGNALNIALENNITSGNKSNASLETSINAGNTLKASLDAANTKAEANITAMESLGDVSELAQNVQKNTNSINLVNTQLSENTQNITQLSNPNLLINGDFKVWQRGTSFTGKAQIDCKYTSDRVYCFTSDDTCTISKVDDGMKIVGQCYIYYRFEDEEYKKLIGKQVTFSYSKNGIITSKTFIMPSTQLMEKTIIENKLGETNIINWRKLELGAIATPFVPRLYGEELALCQRYYEVHNDSIIKRMRNLTSGTIDIGNLGCIIDFKVTKRLSPTVTIKYDISDGTALTSTAGTTSSNSFTDWTILIPTGGWFDLNSWTADAEIY